MFFHHLSMKNPQLLWEKVIISTFFFSESLSDLEKMTEISEYIFWLVVLGAGATEIIVAGPLGKKNIITKNNIIIKTSPNPSKVIFL